MTVHFLTGKFLSTKVVCINSCTVSHGIVTGRSDIYGSLIFHLKILLEQILFSFSGVQLEVDVFVSSIILKTKDYLKRANLYTLSVSRD